MGASLLLLGCGKMGGALLNGWLDAGTADRVVVVEPGGLPDAFAGRAGVIDAAGLRDVPDGFRPDVVILAVKPQVMDAVLPPLAPLAGPDTVFLSIAAGKTLAYLGGRLAGVPSGPAAVVRAMPNTPASIGRGISAAVAGPSVTAAQRHLCESLLRAVGDVAWLADEGLMDAVTAVSGSGPAYVFLLAESLAKAGAAAGLPEDLAVRLARATVAGAGELLHRSDQPAGALREAVTSPGGTTRAALDVLMADDGVQQLMNRAVAAAARRSRELAA